MSINMPGGSGRKHYTALISAEDDSQEAEARGTPLVLREDIAHMCKRTREAMQFYMELHADRQWKHQEEGAFIEAVLRNFHDFYKACRENNEREMLAEGIGMINHIAMFLDIYANDEMEKIQAWKPVLQRLRGSR